MGFMVMIVAMFDKVTTKEPLDNFKACNSQFHIWPVTGNIDSSKIIYPKNVLDFRVTNPSLF